MGHAVMAFGVAAATIFIPIRFFHQLFECLRVTILAEEVARALPAKDAVVWHRPRRALIVDFAFEEVEVERRVVELPLFSSLVHGLEDFFEEFAGFLHFQELVLNWSFFVTITRRDHHPIDTEIGHFVEKLLKVLRGMAKEHSGIRRHAKATLLGFFDCFNSGVESTRTANRVVVMLLDPVHVNREREVFTRGEEIQLSLRRRALEQT